MLADFRLAVHELVSMSPISALLYLMFFWHCLNYRLVTTFHGVSDFLLDHGCPTFFLEGGGGEATTVTVGWSAGCACKTHTKWYTQPVNCCAVFIGQLYNLQIWPQAAVWKPMLLINVKIT